MSTDHPFPPLPLFSANVRFRLGVPSYVYPADILSNAEALAPCVDDIQIALFESKVGSALPSPETIECLRQIASDQDLTYTIHFPLDRKLGSPDRAERITHQQQILRIIELTRSLAPFAYILHVEGVEPTADSTAVKSWQDTVSELLPDIIGQVEVPSQICVENLFYPFEWCDAFLDRFGLGVCLDTGHLQLFGGDVHRHFQRYAERIRVIHLHGVKDHHDHLSLKVLPMIWLCQFLNSIDNFTGVLTLELFEAEAMRQSMERLSQCLTWHSRDPNSKSQTPNSK